MPFFIINIFLGFAGFLLALYIAHKKRRKTEHFVCPLRGSCSEVVHSDFSKFFGIPVEFLGLFYYSIIAIGYGLRSIWPAIDGMLVVPLLSLSTFALIFSFYLTFIQIFTLRKLCTWCLISAFFTLCIFFSSLFSSAQIVIPFLLEYQTEILFIHLIAIALGLGCATLADLFFFKFLKDFRISELEASVLSTFSQVIWFALGVIIMTGLGLFLPESTTLLASDKFLMNLLVAGVIIINGAILNLFITPKFLRIQFGPHDHQPGELSRTRKLAFALGPISIVSWYTLFVLAMVSQDPASFDTMWRVYVGLLIIAVMCGQVIEKFIEKKASVAV